MPHKLPVVSGKQLVCFLQKLGYMEERQRGSHVHFGKQLPFGKHHITVPLHKEIAKGTLNDILTKIALNNQLPKEQLIEQLREI